MEGTMTDIKKLISFLNIEDSKQKDMLDKSFEIIDKKMKKVKKSKTIEDTKKYIKTKKVIKKYGE